MIVIHLGIHKTGTTFLQKNVFNKLENVNLITSSLLRFWYIEEGKTTIISREQLSMSLPHQRFPLTRYDMLDMLNKLFPDAKIIVGIREPMKWLKSCYSQYVLIGGTKSFHEYIHEFKDNIIDIVHYVDEIKKRWKDVLVYHQESLIDEIDNMCTFIGCKTPEFVVKKENISLTDKQILVLRLLYKIFPKNILKYFVLKVRILKNE